MQKPKLTPLQFRNLLTAALMAAAFVWSLTMGVWWLSVILALGCALSITSAILNRPRTS
jgi:uncharacterized membrane protein